MSKVVPNIIAAWLSFCAVMCFNSLELGSEHEFWMLAFMVSVFCCFIFIIVNLAALEAKSVFGGDK